MTKEVQRLSSTLPAEAMPEAAFELMREIDDFTSAVTGLAASQRAAAKHGGGGSSGGGTSG
eukprot:CAMPEP_0118845950 /NCGR_PEP_ID=MMETSP1162-20130426/90719_1 /TAXON_ID=33656 /ORGANISM="Phaeocystis Sp, Strain CCMP2710" /LENGTH=60 /DNA_ID=CAMNT_0006778115 /DNA_START=12 /DNA_END=190 /DNA_ORIENTATION=-